MKRKIGITVLTLLLVLILLTGCKKEDELKIIFMDTKDVIYETITLEDDLKFKQPTDPSKKGYKFEGWFYDNENYEKIFNGNLSLDDFENKVLKLYAKWNVKNIIVSFDSNGGEEISPKSSNITSEFILPEDPIFEHNTFSGWYLDKDLEIKFDVSELSYEKDITLYAKWQSRSAEDFKLYMEENLPMEITDDIILPTTYPGITIEWTSSDEDIVDNFGRYKRPYTDSKIILTAELSGDFGKEIQEYEFNLDGYKKLSNTIASSYIYRDYNKVTDEFFETLDIINCAFIRAEVNGNLTGTQFLYNVETYIMPKAKKEGNWVIASIAPDSYWSLIADDLDKVNDFADNIVNLINDYGFDGVDIDWETPKVGEEKNFLRLIEIVYTKVKENNPNHLVTAAIAAGRWQPPRYDLVNSAKYIDYINMMAYDMASNDGYYQNALYKSPVQKDKDNKLGNTLISCSIDESVKIYNDYGIENSKIIIGIPFYGVKQLRTKENGIWTKWRKVSTVRHHFLVDDYLNNEDYVAYFDDIAKVPYLLKKDGTEFISYDNSKSIAFKCDYIKANNLGGIMYWENGADLTGILLEAINNNIK